MEIVRISGLWGHSDVPFLRLEFPTSVNLVQSNRRVNVLGLSDSL